MSRSFIRRRSVAVTALAGLFSAGTVAALVTHPGLSFETARAALQFWWNLVFPAMLPYLILLRIASAYGLHAFVGRLLAPLVRLLRLPAGAGPVLSAGLLLGGAEGPARAAKLLARSDPESAARLAAASPAANPVLVVTVLAVSLLGSPGAAPVLLFVHYASWLVCALLAAAVRRPAGERAAPAAARKEDARPDGEAKNARPAFGRLLGDAVTESLQNLLELGGVIIVFAVAARVAGLAGLSAALGRLPGAADWGTVLAAGFLELHNGLRAAAESAAHPKIAFCLAGAVLAWGGLAVQLEVRARLRQAGVRYAPVLRFRLVHAALAAVFSAALWPFARHRLAPWQPGAALDAAAWMAPWPAIRGMPSEALAAAALAALLLLLRVVRKAWRAR